MQRLITGIDLLSTWVGKTFSWCILALTFVVSFEVFMRYVLHSPTAWAYDTSYILYGTLFVMCGPYLLARNGHVRGDFMYRGWSVKTQGAVDFALYIIFFIPAILALIYSGWGFAKLSWIMKEHSSFTPDGPPIYPFKMLIPIIGVMLLLQGLVEMARCVTAMRTNKWPARLHDVVELEQLMLEQHAIQDKIDELAHEHAETSGGLR